MFLYRLKKYFYVGSMLVLTSCANTSGPTSPYTVRVGDVSENLPSFHGQAPYSSSFNEQRFAARMPQQMDTNNQKMIVIDPQKFAWGAYDENGNLVRAGIASAGADYCPDEGKPCRTHTGTYRIFSLGDEDCISKTYPIGKGGSLMPYCMFFNGGQSLHGAPDQMVGEMHMSHGCVRLRIPAAEWIRYNFAQVGTRVVVLPY